VCNLYCSSVLRGSDDGKLQLKLLDFWTMYIDLCSEKDAAFRKVDLFGSSGQKVKRWKGTYPDGSVRKLEVKFYLCFFLTKHHAMKAYWGSRGIAPRFLISALDGGQWSASCHSRFTPQGKNPWYPLDTKVGGPQSRSGHGGEEKNSVSVKYFFRYDLNLTNPMKQIYSGETNSHSAGQEIPEGSFPCSQKPAISHYPKRDESIPYLPTLFL
jgi:hypothetical protein